MISKNFIPNILPDCSIKSAYIKSLQYPDADRAKRKLRILFSGITIQEVLLWRNEFEPALDFAQQGGTVDLWMHWYKKKPPLMFRLLNEYNEIVECLSSYRDEVENNVIAQLNIVWHIHKLGEDIENRFKRWDKMMQSKKKEKKEMVFLANEIACQWKMVKQLLYSLLVSFQLKG